MTRGRGQAREADELRAEPVAARLAGGLEIPGRAQRRGQPRRAALVHPQPARHLPDAEDAVILREEVEDLEPVHQRADDGRRGGRPFRHAQHGSQVSSQPMSGLGVGQRRQVPAGRGRRRDVRVDRRVDHGRAAGVDRAAFSAPASSPGASTRDAIGAHRPRQGREVRAVRRAGVAVDEARGQVSSGAEVAALLVADGDEAAVVPDEPDRGQSVLDRGRDDARHEQEAAVADDRRPPARSGAASLAPSTPATPKPIDAKPQLCSAVRGA